MLLKGEIMRATLGAGFLLVALAGAPAVAQEGSSLTIGDRVPAIQIAHFFQGEPVKDLHKDRTYVLEFWATW